MWFEILTALQAHLMAVTELQAVPVVVGDSAKIPSDKRIMLLRGLFDPKTTEAKSTHAQLIYVECWEYDQSEDPLVGYQKLADLESIVLTAINQFGAGATQINNKRVQVRLGQSEPDGDAFRPSIGSRTAVTIRWQ